MTRSKRFLTALLTTATVFTTFIVPASANPDVAYPNLTTYGDTNYTTTIEKTSSTQAQTYSFMVQGAAEDWSSVGGMTETEAKDVEWRFLTDHQGVVLKDLPEDERIIPIDDDEYIVNASVEVTPSAAKAGLVILEAYNSQNGYIDFSILINNPAATVTSVSNIKTYFYDAYNKVNGQEQDLGDVTCAVVSSNNFAGNSNYPSVMDCPLAWLTAPNTPVENYRIEDSYGTSMLKMIQFKGGPTLSSDGDASKPGWQYRVYDGTTGALKSVSAIVGADDYALDNNDIVVWKYGTYEDTEFALSVSVN